LSIAAWDYPPVISKVPQTAVIVNHKPVTFQLQILDTIQKQFLGVNIISLPTKGKLYQRNLDGSMGVPITNIYQRSTALSAVPLNQYATGVANVSSFWGGSLDWSPYQALGPQVKAFSTYSYHTLGPFFTEFLT